MRIPNSRVRSAEVYETTPKMKQQRLHRPARRRSPERHGRGVDPDVHALGDESCRLAGG
jgi:hypothetical protein